MIVEFSKMTYIELFKLQRQIGLEMFKRSWWVLIIVAIVMVALWLWANR